MGDDTFAARYKQTTFLETNGYSAFDPNDCEEFCRDKGYNYFGYGCARTNYIYCWCYDDEMVVSEPETKRCKYVDQNTRRLDKCNGPNELQGLDLGGYKIGSVYKIPGSSEVLPEFGQDGETTSDGLDVHIGSNTQYVQYGCSPDDTFAARYKQTT